MDRGWWPDGNGNSGEWGIRGRRDEVKFGVCVKERRISDWERGLEENAVVVRSKVARVFGGNGMLARHFGMWRNRGMHTHRPLVGLNEEPDQRLFSSIFCSSFVFRSVFYFLQDGRG